MRSLPRFILSTAALALAGTTAMSATPALAQKKKDEKAAKAPALELSKEFRAGAVAAQTAMAKADAPIAEMAKLEQAGNSAGAAAKLAEAKTVMLAAKPAVDALIPLAKNADENYFLGDMQRRVGIVTEDNAYAKAGIERIISSGKADAKTQSGLLLTLGKFAYNAKDYAGALAAFEKARAAGSSSEDLDVLYLDTHFRAGQTDKGIQLAKTMIAARRAAGQAVPLSFLEAPAVALSKAKRNAELMPFLVDRVEYYPTGGHWSDALEGAFRTAPNNDVRIDVYRLRSAANLMKDDYDYNSYSFLAAELGLPAESINAITTGRSKVKIAGAAASEMTARETTQKGKLATDTVASIAASEGAAKSAATGRVAKGTGDAWLSHGENAKAAAMYQLALTKGGVDADLVNTRLGIALARQGDTAGAKAAFAKVSGPAYATTARLWTVYLDKGVKG